MSSMPTISVTPVNGKGWTISGLPRDYVPERFTVALQSSGADHWSGIVLDSGHEFEGRRVDLSRHQGDTSGDVEIVVAPVQDTQGSSSGWGVIETAVPGK